MVALVFSALAIAIALALSFPNLHTIGEDGEPFLTVGNGIFLMVKEK